MSHRVPVSVLKSLSKELLTILKQRDLQALAASQEACSDIITALHVFVPHSGPSKARLTSIAAAPLLASTDQEDHPVALPLAYTDKKWFSPSQTWGLTHQGLREQLLIYASMGAGATEVLMSLFVDWTEKGKGGVFISTTGDNALWNKIFSFAYKKQDLHRLKVINLMTGGRGKPFRSKISHSVSLFAGMDSAQLSEWFYCVMKGWEQSHPHLFNHLPSSVKEYALLFSEVCLVSNQGKNNPLTPQAILNCCDWNVFIELISSTIISKSKPEILSSCHENRDQWIHFLKSWQEFLSWTIEVYDYLFNDEDPDFHLMQSIKKQEEVVILMPAMMKSPEELLAFGNMLGATIYQAFKSMPEFNQEVQNLLMIQEATFAMSPFLLHKFSALRKPSVGVIWHTTSLYREKNKPLHECIKLPSTQMVMRFEGGIKNNPVLDESVKVKLSGPQNLNHLHEGHAYLIAQQPSYPEMVVNAVYRSAERVEHLFLPPVQKPIHEQPDDCHSQPIKERQVQQLMKALDRLNESSTSLSLSWCQETVAKMMGYAHWHEVVSQSSN